MRPSRVFRLIFRIFILLLTLSVTVVSILGGLSAFIILDPYSNNIGVHYTDASFDVDFNNSTGELIAFNFSLPFNITNAGYFDIEDLQVAIKLGIRYEHIDYTVPGQNDTIFIKFFENQQNFGTVTKGNKGLFDFTGDISNVISFPNATQINWYRTPPPDLEFFANFTIGLTYSLGLHSLAFNMHNISIGDYSYP